MLPGHACSVVGVPRGPGRQPLTRKTGLRHSTWLVQAHAQLDHAVSAAFGWDDPDPATVDEETIMTRLLKLNQERSGAVSGNRAN